MSRILILTALCAVFLIVSANAQKTIDPKASSSSAPTDTKKANQRPAETTAQTSEPFDKANVKTLAAQCVKLETESGGIELEMLAETAPETVRNFLNLAAIGAYDTTTFSRVVPGFVIQGGNLATRQTMTVEIAKHARKTISDEPNIVKHIRGIVSMARGEEANTASTHFFILLSEAPNLDGKFAAFGRVTKGMEVVEAINKMPVEGEKPVNPVQLKKATVFACPPAPNTEQPK